MSASLYHGPLIDLSDHHTALRESVAKLMSNKDLILAAAKVRNVTRLRNTLGQRGVLAIRLQPNHPADDLGGMLLSAVEGLLYGCGDAVIGVNPAIESVDTVAAILRALDRLIGVSGAPTQHCCLAHITTQLAALERGGIRTAFHDAMDAVLGDR